MSTFVQALREANNITETENGMKAFKETLDFALDFFFKVPSGRKIEKQEKIRMFEKAYAENKEVATKLLFWLRDVRGGAGERQSFRDILLHCSEKYPNIVTYNCSNVVEFGRWDDLFYVWLHTKNPLRQLHIVEFLAKELEKDQPNGLLCKWMPRKTNNKWKNLFEEVRKFMGLSPKELRKILVNGSKTVEQEMCAKRWSTIEYSEVPSVAFKNYTKAFKRHDEERFSAFLQKAETGETKVNAGAIFPHDVLKNSNEAALVAQWKNLPNYLADSTERIFPIADFSGSMDRRTNPNPIEVARALVLYFSERNVGPYKDAFITFSRRAKMWYFPSEYNVYMRLQELKKHGEIENTNLEAVLDLILSAATKNKVPQNQMPTQLLFLSDMQFDYAVENKSALEMMESKYKEAGYEMPTIVFWNLAADDYKNVPAQATNKNVALVSGSSPSTIKMVVNGDGKNFTPKNIMLKTVLSERYSTVKWAS